MIFNKASLTKGITLAANILANEIRRVTTKEGIGGYPKAIPDSITVGTADVTDMGASIGIFSVDKGEENVELTLAFELGAKPHKIEPKGDYPLRISRESWPNYSPPPDTDPLFFMYVNHPGMKPRPFLDQAFQNVYAKMLDTIGQNFELRILAGPKVEVIK